MARDERKRSDEVTTVYMPIRATYTYVGQMGASSIYNGNYGPQLATSQLMSALSWSDLVTVRTLDQYLIITDLRNRYVRHFKVSWLYRALKP